MTTAFTAALTWLIVQDSVEARWDFSSQGLVVRQEAACGGIPDLERAGVAFRKNVVLRSQLHIGTTPLETPRRDGVDRPLHHLARRASVSIDTATQRNNLVSAYAAAARLRLRDYRRPGHDRNRRG